MKLQSRCIVRPSCKCVGFGELIRLQMICIRGEFASRCSVPQNELRGAVNENETGVYVCVCSALSTGANNASCELHPATTVTAKLRTLHRDFVVVCKHLDVDKPNRSFAFGGQHGWEHVSHGFLESSFNIFHRVSHRSFSMGKKEKRMKPARKIFIRHLTVKKNRL